MPTSDKLKASIVVMLAMLAVLIAAFAFIVSIAQPTNDSEGQDFLALEVSDKEHSFIFSYNRDMQLPELPTGCEATAISTLLRMHGYPASKTDVADAMPKSSWDFFNCFWGDPYKESGGACMAPCAAATANMFIDDGGKAVALKGATLGEMALEGALPACVWVTIDLAEPYPTRTQGDYTCYVPSHCVTVTEVGYDTVSYFDPLSGIQQADRHLFETRFKQLGSQAVFILGGNNDFKLRS